MLIKNQQEGFLFFLITHVKTSKSLKKGQGKYVINYLCKPSSHNHELNDENNMIKTINKTVFMGDYGGFLLIWKIPEEKRLPQSQFQSLVQVISLHHWGLPEADAMVSTQHWNRVTLFTLSGKKEQTEKRQGLTLVGKTLWTSFLYVTPPPTSHHVTIPWTYWSTKKIINWCDQSLPSVN